jgi:hypothetical protein
LKLPRGGFSWMNLLNFIYKPLLIRTNVCYNKNKQVFPLKKEVVYMMNSSHNYRFIERDYWYQQTLCNSEYLLPSQIDDILDQTHSEYCDFTFKFYDDGSVLIIDNETNGQVHPRELSGAVLDFYIRKRIHLIKVNLQEKQLQYA